MNDTPIPSYSTLHTAKWRKAARSQSNTGQCIEVTALPSAIAVRDSKLTGDRFPYLTVTPSAWDALIASIKTT